MSSKHEMNMCEGALLPKIIIYSLPLMATYILQLVFNATDVAVLGMLVGDDAVAAVGATGPLINLITSVFIGVSVGANVIVARFAGSGNTERARKAVGCAVFISVIIGIFLACVGYLGSYTFLEWMKCDADVIGMAAEYLRIYFLGMPIIMLYNFAAAILRAVGDTKRPLIYLVIGGVANVILNVFFILAFGMDVEGVAIATVISQLISVVLCIIALLSSDGYCRLDPKFIRIHKSELSDMLRIGIPSGIQSSMFAIANVLIQSTINSLGKTAMSGSTVATQFDGFIYNAMYAVAAAAISFTSQNYGAGKIHRIRKVMWESMAVSASVGITVGGLVLLFDEQLCSIISDDPAVINIACRRLAIMGSTYFLCGIMDVMSSVMRGLGKSTVATVICLLGSCVFRVIWLNTVYFLNPCIEMVFIVYPISWLLTIAIYMAVVLPMLGRLERRADEKKENKKITAEVI